MLRAAETSAIDLGRKHFSAALVFAASGVGQCRHTYASTEGQVRVGRKTIFHRDRFIGLDEQIRDPLVQVDPGHVHASQIFR